MHGQMINMNELIDDIGRLELMSKTTFSRKKKTSPTSPILLTVKNLDTGKKSTATVVKDLNTGKYELYQLSA